MTITKFEGIIAWQKSQDFVVNTYEILEPVDGFDFKRQIQRASVSISNNIDEGFERATNPGFKRFLFIALASNSKVKIILYLALGLKFIFQTNFDIIYRQSVEIPKLISGFIKSLK